VEGAVDDPNFVIQQLQLLLTAYGYNLYNTANRARADDLLVRERAAGALGDTANQLARVAADYVARCLPPSTREQPFPPPEQTALLRELERLRGEASLLSSQIRGMSVPGQDRTWRRFREETETLHQLLGFDYRLICEAEAAQRHVASLTAETWNTDQASQVRSLLQSIEQVAREREQLLHMPL
jgi:hypothetical protein